MENQIPTIIFGVLLIFGIALLIGIDGYNKAGGRPKRETEPGSEYDIMQTHRTLRRMLQESQAEHARLISANLELEKRLAYTKTENEHSLKMLNARKALEMVRDLFSSKQEVSPEESMAATAVKIALQFFPKETNVLLGSSPLMPKSHWMEEYIKSQNNIRPVDRETLIHGSWDYDQEAPIIQHLKTDKDFNPEESKQLKAYENAGIEVNDFVDAQKAASLNFEPVTNLTGELTQRESSYAELNPESEDNISGPHDPSKCPDCQRGEKFYISYRVQDEEIEEEVDCFTCNGTGLPKDVEGIEVKDPQIVTGEKCTDPDCSVCHADTNATSPGVIIKSSENLCIRENEDGSKTGRFRSGGTSMQNIPKEKKQESAALTWWKSLSPVEQYEAVHSTRWEDMDPAKFKNSDIEEIHDWHTN